MGVTPSPSSPPDPALPVLAPGPGDRPEEIYHIRIARDGTWFHRDGPIRRAGMVRLFASVLRRDAAGDHWLVTPAERGRIAVEDTPFTAVELQVEGEGPARRVRLRTNLDAWVELGPEHPLRVETYPDGTPRPLLQVRPGLEARLLPPVWYALADLAEADPASGLTGVWAGERFWSLEPIAARPDTGA